MISALANFLMLVVYRGGNPQRVAWTLAFFTMGTVAIARLAIEKDRTYSLGYAAVLGLAAFVVMSKFVSSQIFSAFILILIGYLSDRIVRDCTLIDDSIDSSGQGLMDSGRMFVKKQITSADDDGKVAGDNGQGGDGRQASVARAKGGNGQNQPGRTVMYLALGALPLFGLGQFFLRSDAATWHRAQWLLALYLFASLSLLVTTSFLGLRRYLRQRRVDMPSDVSVAWLTGGLAVIAAILFIAYIAPMPGAAIASFELPNLLDSPGTKASRYGWGDEGADEKSPDASSTANDPQQDQKEVGSIRSQEGAKAGNSGDGNREDGPAGKQKGGQQSGGKDQSKSDQGESQKGNQSGQQSKSSQDQSDQQQSGKQNQGNQNQQNQGDRKGRQGDKGEQGDSKKNDGKNGEQSDSQQSDSGQSESGEPDDASENSEADQSGRQRSDSNRQSDASSAQQDDGGSQDDSGISDSMSNVIPAISGFVRFVILAVLFAVVAGYLWIHRDAIAAWWRSLFGGQPEKESAGSFEEFLESETQVPPRAFSSYRNPFGNEKDPRRIVVITFQAFEAWSREQGSTRGKDETPSEFIRRIAATVPQMSTAASQVVDSYNRIVYGRGNASERDLHAARKIWHAMQT